MPKTMLQITNDAMQICGESVRQLSMQANTKLLRISGGSDGVSISFEMPRSDDEIVRHHGQPVLALPDEISDFLSGMTLDVNKEGCLILS